ncbi:MAG: carboxypeptidase-like regulatory domain-containing protein, partial [Candidatus Sulfotelmatobacter sp.]
MECLLVLALEAWCVMLSPAQTASSPPSSLHPAAVQKLTITVTDENGLAVSSARVELQPPPPALPLRCSTDFAGHCEFTDLSSATCELRVEKAGFYAAVQLDVQVGSTANVDVTLSHQREAREVVNVVESPPAIDPAQISAKEELSGEELLDIPYPGPHDYRNALIFMPGVTPDAYGQAHVAGAETYQTLLVLDGFNVTQPTSGALVVQTSIDSFRSVAVTPSREPAEFGKGSGGVMALNTRMGNDHFRFLATDFIPAPQDVKGISLGNWTPIYTMSGPIRKGKMWFFDALDGEYDNYITKQLPSGADFDRVWRIDNLIKLQSNLTTRNIVTASFLSDYFHDPNAGMWALMPPQTTPSEVETAYLGSLKDQYYFRGGALLETGIGGD